MICLIIATQTTMCDDMTNETLTQQFDAHIIDTFKRMRDVDNVHVYHDAQRECTFVVTQRDNNCDVYRFDASSDDDVMTFTMIDDDANVVVVEIDDVCDDE
jgi:hypothetical protein